MRISSLLAGVFNCRKKLNCLYKQKHHSDGFPVLSNTKVNAGVFVGFNSCENEYCGLHEYETVCIGRELGLEACGGVYSSVYPEDGESRFTTVLLPILRADLSCARRLNTRYAF